MVVNSQSSYRRLSLGIFTSVYYDVIYVTSMFEGEHHSAEIRQPGGAERFHLTHNLSETSESPSLPVMQNRWTFI